LPHTTYLYYLHAIIRRTEIQYTITKDFKTIENGFQRTSAYMAHHQLI